MTNNEDIIKLCVANIYKWNKDRYAKSGYNKTLANSLIKEEADELLVADNDVERLDAIADILFVQVGIFYKLGISQTKACCLLDNLLHLNWVNRFKNSNYHTYYLYLLALLIVCISNNTKTIKTVDSSVKANIDKGSNYVGPEKDLAFLLARAQQDDDSIDTFTDFLVYNINKGQ